MMMTSDNNSQQSTTNWKDVHGFPWKILQILTIIMISVAFWCDFYSILDSMLFFFFSFLSFWRKCDFVCSEIWIFRVQDTFPIDFNFVAMKERLIIREKRGLFIQNRDEKLKCQNIMKFLHFLKIKQEFSLFFVFVFIYIFIYIIFIYFNQVCVKFFTLPLKTFISMFPFPQWFDRSPVSRLQHNVPKFCM